MQSLGVTGKASQHLGYIMARKHDARRDDDGPLEIALVGDLTDNEAELSDRLLGVPPHGDCTLYIDSPGGSPYCALSLTALIRLRSIRATGIVTGECSSAALWPFAACTRRIVMPYSVLLFHPMKWQSEEHVGLREAAEWARHFAELEQDMDTGLAELVSLKPLKLFEANGVARESGRKRRFERGAKRRPA
jgi:ATP-dependent Clp protease protease subunit